MKSTRKNAFPAALAASLLFCFASTTLATIGPITAGQNGTGPGEHLIVPYVGTGVPCDSTSEYAFCTTDPVLGVGHWVLGDPNHPIELIADPTAPPMDKWFLSPTDICPDWSVCDSSNTSNGLPSVLPPGWSAPVWEYFLVWPGGDPPFPNPSPAITDWHEHIHEPGWEWIVPTEGSLDPPLITRDGEPWPWTFVETPPPGTEPNPGWLWVEFPPIGPGHVLDIHKKLVWVGTDNNSVWGDGILDNGELNDETMIRVWEYPTIPEPSTLLLGTLAATGFIGAQRRRK